MGGLFCSLSLSLARVRATRQKRRRRIETKKCFTSSGTPAASNESTTCLHCAADAYPYLEFIAPKAHGGWRVGSPTSDASCLATRAGVGPERTNRSTTPPPKRHVSVSAEATTSMALELSMARAEVAPFASETNQATGQELLLFFFEVFC